MAMPPCSEYEEKASWSDPAATMSLKRVSDTGGPNSLFAQ